MEYNNILFFIAGEVIARTSGMSWEAFIAKIIFEPAGMESSVASISRIGNLPLAKPHATSALVQHFFTILIRLFVISKAALIALQLLEIAKRH